MATETDNLLDDVRAAAAQIEQGGGDANNADGRADNLGSQPGALSPDARSEDQVREQPSRDRDEAGRFKAKEEGKPRETLTLKEKVPADTTGTKENAGQPATDAAARPANDITATADKPAPILAPTEWRGAAKVKWDRLPREVQAEIVERHTAAERRAAQYAPLEQAIAPYRDAWMRDAGSVEQAIGQLGQFYHLYLTNPVGLIQHIARSRGIDLGAPQGQQPTQGGTPITQLPPEVASLVNRTAELQQRIASFEQRAAQSENQQLNDVISAFGADPKHPFFQDVKVHMGQLLANGAAKDLNEAYDQATWANPTIRAHLLAAQGEEAKKQQAAEVAKANAARAASLRGSPLPGGGNAAANGSASVLDDVRAAAAEIAGA